MHFGAKAGLEQPECIKIFPSKMIDASDEDGSCGHLIQNSLNFIFMILEINILGVVRYNAFHDYVLKDLIFPDDKLTSRYYCNSIKSEIDTSDTETESDFEMYEYMNQKNQINVNTHGDQFSWKNRINSLLTKKSKSQIKSLKGETTEKMSERHQWTKEEKAALTRHTRWPLSLRPVFANPRHKSQKNWNNLLHMAKEDLPFLLVFVKNENNISKRISKKSTDLCNQIKMKWVGCVYKS
ncbi:hypothetical protein KUTeg_017345 [Tegillarca granosa]|uniref:Uncharacterized protein n=1 Tax=Tegillarca granosa TaxID=220873 RepID=A0ABQ9EIK0_TEGGR|nr:hypothetical protein KUTeg_017345 [Tegillarca granosa]